MDVPPPNAWFETCACGRTFSLPQAYSYHKNTCRTSKKRFADEIRGAKEVYLARKRRKVDLRLQAAVVDQELPDSDFSISGASANTTSNNLNSLDITAIESTPIPVSDQCRSMSMNPPQLLTNDWCTLKFHWSSRTYVDPHP